MWGCAGSGEAILTASQDLRRSIFSRTATVVVVLAGAVWTASSLFVVSEQRANEVASARGMAEVLAGPLAEITASDDPAIVTRRLSDLVRSHAALRYVVIERAGRVYADSFTDGFPSSLAATVLHDRDVVHGSVIVHRLPTGGDHYDACVRIDPEGTHLHLGTARGPLNAATRSTLRSISAGSLVSLAIGLALAWVIARMTTVEVDAAQSAVRESEVRYRQLFEQAPDSIMLLEMDPERGPVVIDANRATCRQHGCELDELIGVPIREIVVPEGRERVNERAQRVMAGEVATFEAEHLRCDGTTLQVEVIARVVELNGRKVIQTIERDISERRRAEARTRALQAQLEQAKKMEAIGRLASCVAHDTNNILGAIRGAASLLESELGSQSHDRSTVASILAACRQGQALTRNLLGFTRSGPRARDPVSLNDVVDETVRLLLQTLPEGVVLETRLGRDLPTTEGDRGQISQAIMNVCLNAIDAVENGRGTVVVSTSCDQLEATRSHGGRQLPDRWAVVRIEDSGPGIEPEHLERVFEPFFTTKTHSKGTGLGLAMVYGTMESHGGRALLESTPGVGTVVRLVFPAREPAATVPAADSSAGAGLAPGWGEVLVVDDEPLLRTVQRKMLQRLGYTVHEAVDGRTALEVLKARADTIGVVVLDLALPGTSGREVFFEVRRLGPEIPVVLTSGGGDEELVDELLQAGASSFIAKPVDLRTLGAAVAAALASGCQPVRAIGHAGAWRTEPPAAGGAAAEATVYPFPRSS